MPGDQDTPIEPEDDLSDAARQLGDRFLPESADPEDTSTTEAVGFGQARAEFYDRILADLFRDTDLADEWQFVARLEARARHAEDADAPRADWDSIVPQLVVRLRDGEPGVSEPWIRLAGTTDIDIRMVVQDTPYLPPPPAAAAFSWEAMAEHTDLDFRLIVRDDDGATDDESDRQYRIDPAGSSADGGWHTIGPIDYDTPLSPPTVTGRIGWNLELTGDAKGAGTADAQPNLSSDDFSFAPDNFLQTPGLEGGPVDFRGHYDLGGKVRLSTELTFGLDRGSEMLSPDVPFAIDQPDDGTGGGGVETGAAPKHRSVLDTIDIDEVISARAPRADEGDTAAKSDDGTPESDDPAWDAEVARANARLEGDSNLDHETGLDDYGDEDEDTHDGEDGDAAWAEVVAHADARIQDSNLDHETGVDEESGTGLDEAFGREDASPPTPPVQSVLDYVDPVPERPPSSPLEAVDQALEAKRAVEQSESLEDTPPTAPPTPPAQSVLDYIDSQPERPPSSPFEAIDRELEAERRSLYRRVPTWIWPTAATVIIALGALFLLSGGEDEPVEAVAGGGDAPAATATSPPESTTPSGNVEATVSPTEAPAIAPTMTAVEFPTLRICPDGSSFSGYEQPDGSFLDAESGEVRVCPPPPN